jgi:dipeptidyl aminopeptidase
MIASVTIDTAERKQLTDVTQPGYYSASFSTGAGYYLLSYQGPEVPWQKVKKVTDGAFNIDVEDNIKVRAMLNATQVPTRRWSTVSLNGHGTLGSVMTVYRHTRHQSREADENNASFLVILL